MSGHYDSDGNNDKSDDVVTDIIHHEPTRSTLTLRHSISVDANLLVSDDGGLRSLNDPFSEPEVNIGVLQRRAARLKGLRKRLLDSSAWRQERRERRARKREHSEVHSWYVCKSIDIEALFVECTQKAFEMAHFRTFDVQPQKFDDVMCLYSRTNFDAIYVFEYGCIVFWNCTAELEEEFLSRIRRFMIAPLADDDTEDDGYFFVNGEVQGVRSNTITLGSTMGEEKLAVSFAMAQSVRLSVFEESVEADIVENRHLPLELATTGRISLSAIDLSRRMGRIFLQRSEVNLHCDILDTPEFFWEHKTHVAFYRVMRQYVEIEKRTSILNTRLLVMKEQLDMLKEEVKTRHATFLEWIVIVLIVVEVILQLAVIIFQTFIHKTRL